MSFLAGKAAEFSVHVAFGMPVKEKVESILFNAAVLIGPDGELIGDYRKLHLRGEEKLAFRPGYRLPVFETEFGNLGVHDRLGPGVPGSGAQPRPRWRRPDHRVRGVDRDHTSKWRAYTVARACENAVYIAAANRVGQEPSYTFGGESMLVGPRGGRCTPRWMRRSRAMRSRPSIWTKFARRARSNQLLQCRQPAAYRSWCENTNCESIWRS